jgi:hypothetical protein
VCDVTPELLLALIPELPLALTLGLPFGLQPCNPFALVASPKLGLRQQMFFEHQKQWHKEENTRREGRGL